MAIFLEILGFLLTIVAVGFLYYISVKKSIEDRVIDAINYAEDLSKVEDTFGHEKMEDAISFIKSAMPSILKPFVSDAMIEKAVQLAFDKIEDYAKKQVK